jgi:hypothetical protein
LRLCRFLDDYSSEDYEDVDVNEVQHQTWLEVPSQFLNSKSDHEVLSDAVEAVEAEPALKAECADAIDSSDCAEATTIPPATTITPLVTWNTLTDMDSTREATVVRIHQRQDWETMKSEGSSPAFMCGIMLKNWIEPFLFEIARLRIRFYRSIATAFRKATRKDKDE